MSATSSAAIDLARRHAAALELLLGRINYERADTMPQGPLELKLDRMRELAARLGNPHLQYPVIHVAGTKGKGSVSKMVAAVLSAAGLKTGLFTSPHLVRVEERFAIDGVDCSAEHFVELVEHLWRHIPAMDEAALRHGEWPCGPTYFELTTALAMVHFARRRVDAAVLEVGLGGRLDSTNICQPAVSVITSISFDHMKQLGNTLAEIAGEKAGIVKPGVPVVSGVTADEPRGVVARRAAEFGCRLTELGRDFDFRYHPPADVEWPNTKGQDDREASSRPRLDFSYRVPGCQWELRDLELNLLGEHQGLNAAVALATLAELRRAGWNISEGAVRQGLRQATLPARVEVVSRRPTVVIDAAHNVASVQALVDTLDDSFARGPRTLIFATTKDKDLRGMLALLVPAFDELVLTRYLSNPRTVDPDQLNRLAGELTTKPRHVFQNPTEAWRHASRQATPDHLMCITGSFFLASEMRPIIAQS